MSKLEQKHSYYFLNPIVDALMMGGASVLFFAILRIAMPSVGKFSISVNDLMIAGIFNWILNWPHFAASYLRLRDCAHQKISLITRWSPLILIVLIGLSLRFPQSIAPLFFKLFVIWSPFHYASQNFGLSLLYLKRRGISFSSLERNLLKFHLLCGYASYILKLENLPQATPLFSLSKFSFPTPSRVPEAFVFMTCFSLILLIGLIWKKHRSLGAFWMPAIPVAAQGFWFLAGADFMVFQLFVPAAHAMQYLLVSWATRPPGSIHSPNGSRISLAISTPSITGQFVWAGQIFTLGFLLFFALPQLLGILVPDPLLIQTLVFASVQVHHFIVDGNVWKLRREAANSPLFVPMALENR